MQQDPALQTIASEDQARAREAAREMLASAALVHPFDPLTLMPNDLTEEVTDRVLTLVALEAGEVVWAQSAGKQKTFWRLNPASRRRELSRLVAENRIESLLERVRPMRGDRFSRYLRHALAGSPIPSTKIAAADRDIANAALSFASEALAGRPAEAVRANAGALRDKIARQAEDNRIRTILPRPLFGRERERKVFDGFVRSGIVRTALPEPSPSRFEIRPFLLTGAFGTGKSAFVADLVRRRRKANFSGPPSVLLDFGKPTLGSGSRLDWIIETTRQLGFGHPELDQALRQFRAVLRQHQGNAEKQGSDFPSGPDVGKELEPVLGKSVHAGSVLLLVLDGLETVIDASGLMPARAAGEGDPSVLERLLDWVASLCALRFEEAPVFKAVRVIAVGRDLPTTDRDLLGQWFCAVEELGPLSEQAAVDVLRSESIENKFDDALAARAVDAFDRQPDALVRLGRYAQSASSEAIEATIEEAEATEPGSTDQSA